MRLMLMGLTQKGRTILKVSGKQPSHPILLFNFYLATFL